MTQGKRTELPDGVILNRQKLDCFQGVGWVDGGPADQDQADEDQLMEFLQALLGPLDALAACCGGNLEALRIVRAAKPTGGSLVDTARKLVEQATWVRRFQNACEPLGVHAQPDVYNFQDLWLYERTTNEHKSIRDDRLETEAGEYFVVRVRAEGFLAGDGDGYHRSFCDSHGIHNPETAWEQASDWVAECLRLAEVAKVQTR